MSGSSISSTKVNECVTPTDEKKERCNLLTVKYTFLRFFSWVKDVRGKTSTQIHN